MSDLDEVAGEAEGGALAELDLGTGGLGWRQKSGPRSGTKVVMEVVRELEDEDLPLLLAPEPEETPISPIARLKSVHHELAMMLVKGVQPVEAALITGYSTKYIKKISTEDPAFRELLSHYEGQREEAFLDVLQRLKSLGLEASDIIRDRIREEPERWTNQQLMELMKNTLVEPSKNRFGLGGEAGTQVMGDLIVNFVKPGGDAGGGRPIFEGEATEVMEVEDGND